MLALALEMMLPFMTLMPSSAMSSVVPVAMAMLPEKVEHDANAVASPEFWMVVVAEMVQSAVLDMLAKCHTRPSYHQHQTNIPAARPAAASAGKTNLKMEGIAFGFQTGLFLSGRVSGASDGQWQPREADLCILRLHAAWARRSEMAELMLQRREKQSTKVLKVIVSWHATGKGQPSVESEGGG